MIPVFEEVHVDGIPVELSYFSLAKSTIQIKAFIASSAVSVCSLIAASLQVCKADSVVSKVIGPAFGAIAISIGDALWISELAFGVGIDEVETVAIDAKSVLIEIIAVLI